MKYRFQCFQISDYIGPYSEQMGPSNWTAASIHVCKSGNEAHDNRFTGRRITCRSEPQRDKWVGERKWNQIKQSATVEPVASEDWAHSPPSPLQFL